MQLAITDPLNKQLRRRFEGRGSLSIPETSRELGVSNKTLYRLIESGYLKAFRIGRVWRVGVEEISRIKAGAGTEGPG